jgi:hypothetical protein
MYILIINLFKEKNMAKKVIVTEETLRKRYRLAKKSSERKVKNEFLKAIHSNIDYWESLPDKTTRERIEGIAFSILVILDGESIRMPPFAVRPLDENGNEGISISGELHDSFFKIK